jgi:hypothetical protein
MDRFELNWPGADASFYTDGWRCRIVWREKGRRNGGGGMGGTIDNNQQCVKRAAESLEGAPYFLSALKARGHERLAEQIESAADEVAAAPASPAPVRNEQPRATRPHPAPKRVERVKGSERAGGNERVERRERAESSEPVKKREPTTTAWLAALDGAASFESARDKRARAWIELGALNDPHEVLLLKLPAAKGKAEWVLKRTWPEDGKRKPEFVVAEAFKGIATWLVGTGLEASGVEQLLAALAKAGHPELDAAARAWRSAGRTH